jgi:hypothetical protein
MHQVFSSSIYGNNNMMNMTTNNNNNQNNNNSNNQSLSNSQFYGTFSPISSPQQNNKR